ncbi:spore germination protein [Alicyclobacillus tolerans]|uniref:spore germination protein n=1 Tax=Alicyclobacillus tolerans TaxID=90970 RepID=UPI001F26D069|nr:spore germination protein [Alicyclobacillus tolerans]MCF8563355.1 spore germination protein [Alicyclobacillus tolerans]
MNRKVEGSWQRNHAAMKEYLWNNDGVVFREFQVGRKQAFLVYTSGLTDKVMLAQSIVAPLIEHKGPVREEDILNTISVPAVQITHDIQTAAQKVLERQTVLFVDGLAVGFLIDASAGEQRNVQEPESETVIRGPHTGFIESLTVNLSWIIRDLQNPKLHVEKFVLGTDNRVTCALVYLDGMVHAGILSLVKKRLEKIDVDAILGCGYIEQLIEDAPNTIFPTVRHTERPDVVVAALLEGRVAILTDNCPTALMVPHLFMDNFQGTEDYHSRRHYSSLMRFVRMLGFFLATQLCAIYISIENFHKELIPSDLLLSIAGSREGVPFPLPLEVLLMVFAFELIKEAGLRMPKAISSSVSIVGGLILGQAAVDSGFVGIPTVIIVAVSGISTFLTSGLIQAVSLIRLLSLIPASFLGLYGLILFDILLVVQAASLKSFGVPYLAPIVPTYLPDWKDSFVRRSIKILYASDKERKHNIGRYFVEEVEP